MKPKIELTDSIHQVLYKMSEGNPGALSVLCQILKETERIDPDDALGGIGVILSLDTLGLYGSKIWMLFTDVCRGDLPTTLAVLRGWQLGFASEDEIRRAVDFRGQGLNVPDLYAKVSERLPRFFVAQKPATPAKS